MRDRSSRARDEASRFALLALRPGFTTLTFAAALCITALAGALTESFAGEGAIARSRAERADAVVRGAMLQRGWQPLEATPRGDVETLVAERDFELPLLSGTLHGKPPSPARAEHAAQLVAAELAIYPPGFLRSVGVSRVLLCSKLSEAGLPIPSLPNYERTLLLDVEGSDAFLRRVVHHELFHFVDFADDQRVGDDPAWRASNDPFFVYGDGGRFQRDPSSSHLTDALPGFLTGYAMSALEEDKAEVFAFMVVAPGRVKRIAAADRVVAAKVARIRMQMSAVRPALDASFWRRVAARAPLR